MKSYCVGGAVRDTILGLSIKDKDYVVVGATPQTMLDLGFKAVGKDFPVFLHPQTHAEYALARTERKTSKGYKGFEIHASSNVTLEEDLSRRDFTMNAIAEDDDGLLIDPFHGQSDIQAKIIRHVSPAFVEDPVRILRAARFSARFTDFSIADETMDLMVEMVETGEVDALVPERVWQELSRGLMEIKPSRMFEVLRTCGALKVLLPELDRLWGVPQPVQHHPEVDTGVHVMMVIDYAAKEQFSLAVRFAALLHDLGKGMTPSDILPRHIGHELKSFSLVEDVCQRLRVPNECKDLAKIVAKFHGKLHTISKMRPETLLNYLIELDAIRQPDRFEDFLKACEADSRGRTGMENCALLETELLKSAYRAVLNLDAGAVAKGISSPEKIKEAIFDARLELVKKNLF